jgi:hypothetical protein
MGDFLEPNNLVGFGRATRDVCAVGGAESWPTYLSAIRASGEMRRSILSRILELNGYSVWFDYGLFSGINFGRQIEREIRAAKAVVVLWCSLSRVSR